MKNLILTAGILFAVCTLSGVEIANPKQAGAWNLRFPGKRHQTFRVEQYSQKEGAAAEIKAEPHIFKYSELQLEQPVVIAERPEDFQGELVLKFRPDTPETFAAVSAEGNGNRTDPGGRPCASVPGPWWKPEPGNRLSGFFQRAPF